MLNQQNLLTAYLTIRFSLIFQILTANLTHPVELQERFFHMNFTDFFFANSLEHLKHSTQEIILYFYKKIES